MSEFKAGARVRCVNVGDNTFITEGKVYEVRDTYSSGGELWVSILSNTERPGSYLAYRFELVTEPANHKTNDAPTSVAAAVSIKPKKASIKDVILELLDTYKTGLTGQEIAEYSGFRLNSVTPRFAELSRGASPKIADTGRTRSGQIVWALCGA